MRYKVQRNLKPFYIFLFNIMHDRPLSYTVFEDNVRHKAIITILRNLIVVSVVELFIRWF